MSESINLEKLNKYLQAENKQLKNKIKELEKELQEEKRKYEVKKKENSKNGERCKRIKQQPVRKRKGKTQFYEEEETT